MRLFLTILISLILVGCLSPRKADRQLANIDNKFPEKVAANCISKYPCKEGEIVIDTVYEVKDSIIEIPCEFFDTIRDIRIDTVVRRVVSVKKVIEYKNRTIYTDRYFVDSARIKLLIIENNKQKAEFDKSIKKKNKLLNIISGALISLLLLILLLILLLSKRR